jgi:hypothetical protein
VSNRAGGGVGTASAAATGESEVITAHYRR